MFPNSGVMLCDDINAWRGERGKRRREVLCVKACSLHCTSFPSSSSSPHLSFVVSPSSKILGPEKRNSHLDYLLESLESHSGCVED